MVDLFAALRRKFNMMGPDPSIALTDNSFGVFNDYGEPAEIPLRHLMNYFLTDVQYRLAVMTYTAHSAGNGYYTTADESKPIGRKALEIVNDFSEDWNLDELNITTAMEAWATGNSYDHFVGTKDKPFSAIYKVPISTIVRIKREETGRVVSYVQQTSQGHYVDVMPEEIGHFKFLTINQNAFGEGLGQIMAREGLGYKIQNGKRVSRTTFFKINEFLTDFSAKLIYHGVPRYRMGPKEKGVINDELRKQMQDTLNTMDVGQHITTTFPAEMESVSLDTQNRFDSLIRNITESRFAGLMTPIDRLWSLNSFNYASSKEATKEMLPLVSMFQRFHKRYIEQNIFAPILIQEGRDPRKADVRLHWGEVEPKTVEEIKDVWEILQHPKFVDSFVADDFVSMLNDIGFKLTPVQRKKEAQAINSDMAALRKIVSLTDNDRKKITTDKLMEELHAEKLSLIRRLAKFGK